MKANEDIRKLIKVSGLCTWQVANKLEIHENSFYRILRTTLDEDEKKRVIKAINELQKERELEVSKLNGTISGN